MKKILAILCAVLMLASLAAAASAEEAPQTTTITTTVPSTYVLTIPATVEIPYGEKNATIGSVKVTGRITNDQYVKVTAETTTNFCLVNDSDSSARISYRPEDIFASAVNGSAPIFRGRDFSAKEVNGNGGSCLVVARISYRPEDIFASAVNGSAPIFRGRDFSAKEVNGNGGSCLVVARISDYAWEHAAAGTYSDTITFTASLETANAAG